MIHVSENTNDNQHKHTKISRFHADFGQFGVLLPGGWCHLLKILDPHLG